MGLLELVDYLSWTGLIIIFGTYTALAYYWFRHMYKSNKKRKEEFYKTLLNALKLETISSLTDVYNIYNGLNNRNVSSGNIHLNSLLKGFIAELHKKDLGDLSKEEIKVFKEITSEFIKKNQEISPYSELPDSERNILNDITTFLDTSDNDSIKRKMGELALLIQSRKELLDKVEKQNKWSVPLAVIGLILTIIFGITSLI